ncbi:AAA family ATPase [Nocardia takedensis]
MLRSFRVGNHRSFADENELLLMPVADDRAAVPVAAIYGANASGKSNLLDGLRAMQRAVLESFARWEPFSGVPRDPFRFRASHMVDVPSTYVIEIVAEKIPWTYGFSVDNERVLEEWLFSYPEKRKRVLFQRTEGRFTFGSTVADHRSQLASIRDLTRPNALFLSAVAQARPDLFEPVHRWFRRTLILSDGRTSSTATIARRLRDALLNGTDEDAARLIELVRVADFGIVAIDVPSTQLPEIHSSLTAGEVEVRLDSLLKQEKDLEDLRWKGKTRESGLLSAFRDFSIVVPGRDHGPKWTMHVGRDVGQARSSNPPVLFTHHGSEAAALTLEQESAGTIAWLEILPGILDALDNGRVTVIDEIDTSLHPLLTAALIELFQSEETNQHGAQLILTTHDSSLLGTVVRPDGLLHRDQVWFVEKSQDGTSTLYPLTDYKPRNEHNLERRYLGGSFGAVPDVDFHQFVEALRHADPS